ncbi:MAG TPA: hypothetical protein VI653_18775 [Steroidobacteraceae bacterium]
MTRTRWGVLQVAVGLLAAQAVAGQQAACKVPALEQMDSAGKRLYACGAVNASGAWGNSDTQQANPVLGLSWISAPTLGTRFQLSGTGMHDIVWVRNAAGARDRKKNQNEYELTFRTFTESGGIPLVPFLGEGCVLLCAFEVRVRSTFNEFKQHEITSLVVAGPWFFLLGSPGSSQRLGVGLQPGLRRERTRTTFSGDQFIILTSLDVRGNITERVKGGFLFSYAPRISGSPSTQSYRTSFAADLNLPINQWLTVIPAFEHRHDSQPPPGARTKDDYQAKLYFQIATPFGPSAPKPAPAPPCGC